MWDWYWIGVAAGLGVAGGLSLLWATRRGPSLPPALVLALAALAGGGAIAALAVPWAGIAVASGAAVGLASARGLSTEAIPAGVLAGAALAFVPALGYLEALAAPLLAWRQRRRAGDRHAGLRILAKD